MMPMAHEIKTGWPAKFKYVGEPGIQKRVITEIRRPDPEACLVVKKGDVVELSLEQYIMLFHGERGPLVPDGIFQLVHAAPKPNDPGSAKPSDPADKGGDKGNSGAGETGKTGDKK